MVCFCPIRFNGLFRFKFANLLRFFKTKNNKQSIFTFISLHKLKGQLIRTAENKRENEQIVVITDEFLFSNPIHLLFPVFKPTSTANQKEQN